MTFAMLDKVLSDALPKQLQTKVIFDNVESQAKKMPEIAVSGDCDKTGNLADKSQLNGTHYTPIVAELPNFRKEIGISVSEAGFIKLPRTLLKSEVWRSLRLRQQKLFLYILEKAQFTHYVFKYNGVDIPLSPGDLCNSYRGLAEDFNQTVRFREEKIDAPFVQRAVSTFSKHGLTDTRTDTGILVISIIYPGIYDDVKNTTDTPTDTGAIQQRYTNEERKKDKNAKETIEGEGDSIRSPLLNKKEEEQRGPSIFDTEPETPKLNELSEEQKKMLPELWKYALNLEVTEAKTKCGKPGIKQSDLVNWLKAGYEVRDIAESMKIASPKQIRITYGAYITKLLKEKIPKKKGNIEINDEFLNQIIKTHQCLHLENHKQYVTDKIKHTDYQKNSEPQRFKEMIMDSIEMAKNYDGRERDERPESDYEDDY